MGRARAGFVKRAGDKIVKEYKERLGSDFTKNKKVAIDIAEIRSKKLVNLIAGYITKKINTQQEFDLGAKKDEKQAAE